MGACAGANLRASFDGDASLRRRPMEPVAAQLRAFGAKIDTTQGRLPLALHGTPRVETRRFILLAPSAQVKSALLFAALFGGVAIRVDGDRGSRDHTERLLRYLGAQVEWDQRSVSLSGGTLRPRPVAVAGDFSAAAFFITAAVNHAGKRHRDSRRRRKPDPHGPHRRLAGDGSRDRAAQRARILRRTGSRYRRRTRAAGGDDRRERPRSARHGRAAAGCRSGGLRRPGRRQFPGSRRCEPKNRIAPLRSSGFSQPSESRVRAKGGRCGLPAASPAARGGLVSTEGDHRVAMAAAVLACAAGPLEVAEAESVDVSFPEFAAALASLRAA